MARADEPRITIRLSRVEYERVRAASMAADCAVGALARECLLRFAPATALAVSEEGVRLRRRSGVVPVQSPAASSRVETALEVRAAVAARREGQPLAFPSDQSAMVRAALERRP